MNGKQCNACGLVKDYSAFNKNKGTKDGYLNNCRDCLKQRAREPCALFKAIYRAQVKRRTVHYSAEELYEWAQQQPNFKSIFLEWRRVNYSKKLTPSIDRLDDYGDYSLDNIQLVTWEFNDNKHKADRKEGRNNKVNQRVVRIGQDGTTKEYHSVREASRQNSINISSICLALSGKYETAGGFKWARA